MLQCTKQAIVAIAKTDPSISADQMERALAALEGETQERSVLDVINKEPIDRLLSVGQVAEIQNLSTKSVLRYCKNGLLRRIVRRGGVRATGILESSVRAFVAGKEAA